MIDPRREQGVALVIAMMALLLMSGLGLALVATTSSETLIAANFRASADVFYAADAMAGRAVADLRSVSDWTTVLTGETRSSFVDGAPAGVRVLADGTPIDLAKILNLANCNKTTACTPANMDAVTAIRPWGPNNPRWQLYAYGRLDRLQPSAAVEPGIYILAMVGDDPAEADGDPVRDTAGDGPGAGIVSLRVEAFGARAAHKVVEITLENAAGLRVISWRP